MKVDNGFFYVFLQSLLQPMLGLIHTNFSCWGSCGVNKNTNFNLTVF
jgi:hypothetical protein